jgi:hypothetical protein
MPKPDYLSLFAQLEVETDPVQRQALLDQLYNFAPPVPLPEGETVEDYLLSDEEIEKFGYVNDDYVQPNPGTEYAEVDALFVLPDYVAEGYINIENNAISPYYVEGYAEEGFVVLGGSVGGYIAYVGKYYNDLGEST